MPSQHVPRTCSQEEKLLFRPCLTDKKATFRGIEVFVKGRTVDLENDSAGSVLWTGDDGEMKFPNKEQFSMMVETHLKMNLNLSIEGNTLFKLWPSILNRESFSEQQNKVLLERRISGHSFLTMSMFLSEYSKIMMCFRNYSGHVVALTLWKR